LVGKIDIKDRAKYDYEAEPRLRLFSNIKQQAAIEEDSEEYESDEVLERCLSLKLVMDQ